MFIRQADVFAAFAAYTDHEIGRVIQTVEDLGKLGNTLIIYIEGDNGTSSEGTLTGTPNEVAMFNGVDVPVELQLKYFSPGIRTGPTITWRYSGRRHSARLSPGTTQIVSHLGGVRQGMGLPSMRM